jgi:hypothetical protein
MYENSVGPVAPLELDCEALCIVQEAETLAEMTLVCCDIDVGDVDAEPVSTDPLVENVDKGDLRGMGFCVAQVKKAAQAVVEEARRLQFEVERYANFLLTGAAGDNSDSVSAPEESTPIGIRAEIVLEAMAIVSEAKRLQELVLRLIAHVDMSAEEEKNNNE